jgi:hypothetical protein
MWKNAFDACTVLSDEASKGLSASTPWMSARADVHRSDAGAVVPTQTVGVSLRGVAQTARGVGPDARQIWVCAWDIRDRERASRVLEDLNRRSDPEELLRSEHLCGSAGGHVLDGALSVLLGPGTHVEVVVGDRKPWQNRGRLVILSRMGIRARSPTTCDMRSRAILHGRVAIQDGMGWAA